MSALQFLDIAGPIFNTLLILVVSLVFLRLSRNWSNSKLAAAIDELRRELSSFRKELRELQLRFGEEKGLRDRHDVRLGYLEDAIKTFGEKLERFPCADCPVRDRA